MKKLILLMAAACICGFAGAQQKVYCELLGQGKLFSSKVTVTVDFGQDQWQNNKLVDENGKKIVFNSMIDAMNFMGKLGWEFEQAYVITVGSGSSAQNVNNWLLSRYIGDGEAIDEGIKTKSQYKAESAEQDEPRDSVQEQ